MQTSFSVDFRFVDAACFCLDCRGPAEVSQAKEEGGGGLKTAGNYVRVGKTRCGEKAGREHEI
jgi:hypothetical protein